MRPSNDFTKYELRARLAKEEGYELRITPIEARADFRDFREIISLYLKLPDNGVKIPRCTARHQYELPFNQRLWRLDALRGLLILVSGGSFMSHLRERSPYA